MLFFADKSICARFHFMCYEFRPTDLFITVEEIFPRYFRWFSHFFKLSSKWLFSKWKLWLIEGKFDEKIPLVCPIFNVRWRLLQLFDSVKIFGSLGRKKYGWIYGSGYGCDAVKILRVSGGTRPGSLRNRYTESKSIVFALIEARTRARLLHIQEWCPHSPSAFATKSIFQLRNFNSNIFPHHCHGWINSRNQLESMKSSVLHSWSNFHIQSNRRSNENWNKFNTNYHIDWRKIKFAGEQLG